MLSTRRRACALLTFAAILVGSISSVEVADAQTRSGWFRWWSSRRTITTLAPTTTGAATTTALITTTAATTTAAPSTTAQVTTTLTPTTTAAATTSTPPRPQSITAAGLSTFRGCTLMPANTIFHADVRALPTHAQSATWLDTLGANRGGGLKAAWGGDQWMGNTAGMPVNIASASQPNENVIFNRGYATSGPSIDDRTYAIPDYPLVEGMPSAPAYDRHLMVFQEGSCRSQELYNVANGVELPANSINDALGNAIYANAYGASWIAEAGVQFDMNSALYPTRGEANASHLPYLPLMLRPDELTRGSIDHMLGITIGKDRGRGFAWPALAGDGTATSANAIPMGTVFRLRSDVDITKYSPSAQVILRALQKHGAVIYDSFNAGPDGATLLAMGNGWTGTDYLSTQRELNGLAMNLFEAVNVSSLAVSPATSWQTR
ncbi:MAG: hypothetical protein ACOYNI_04125 [Acidimicrobiia bacterium]